LTRDPNDCGCRVTVDPSGRTATLRLQMSRPQRCGVCRTLDTTEPAEPDAGCAGAEGAIPAGASILRRALVQLLASPHGSRLQRVHASGIAPASAARPGEHDTLFSLGFGPAELRRVDIDGVRAVDRIARRLSVALEARVAAPGAPAAACGDARFVSRRGVLASLPDGANLAALPADDFEQLAAEILALEYREAGISVRVTRASADGGTDLVLFDPDPIRGGRIVVQVKRSAALIKPAAVRELYGVVVSEGAMKGILVTTSAFGRASYDFARARPLSLVDGVQLLGLMARHGIGARIDFAASRSGQRHIHARSDTCGDGAARY
jgi:restriction system protein